MKNINERRRARLGPNDYKRNKRAGRQEERTLTFLTFIVILWTVCVVTSL
jgi:hypothetical protein